MMWLLDKIAEERIREAVEKGELDGLPGAGAPLVLDDDALVPEHLRAGYRLLKNAGYLPAELQVRKEIEEVEQLLAQVDHGDGRAEGLKRLRLLMDRLHQQGQRRENMAVQQEYYDRLIAKLERS